MGSFDVWESGSGVWRRAAADNAGRVGGRGRRGRSRDRGTNGPCAVTKPHGRNIKSNRQCISMGHLIQWSWQRNRAENTHDQQQRRAPPPSNRNPKPKLFFCHRCVITNWIMGVNGVKRFIYPSMRLSKQFGIFGECLFAFVECSPCCDVGFDA
jgi:hypothetical protein